MKSTNNILKIVNNRKNYKWQFINNQILSDLKMQKSLIENEIQELKMQQLYLQRAVDQNDSLVQEN